MEDSFYYMSSDGTMFYYVTLTVRERWRLVPRWPIFFCRYYRIVRNLRAAFNLANSTVFHGVKIRRG